MKYYVRFGDIPDNEESDIWAGDEIIGKEKGVSVYPAYIDENYNIILGITFPITRTTLYTLQQIIEYDTRPCYLVTGDVVGNGSDNEPLLKNVKLMKEIKDYRLKI